MILRAVLSALAGLALALTLPAARAQAPAAPTLHVVALATLPAAKPPATTLPENLRGNPLYWRVLRSPNAVSYQLCLGFFQTQEEAERARRQLAARFPEARVIQVNAQERDNLQKAARAAATAAPAARAAALPPVPPAAALPPASPAAAPPPAPAAAAVPPPPRASPPPAEAPTVLAQAPAGSPEALMAEGRGAIVREDYAAAIGAFTALLALPPNALTRDAQEFLALSYERRGDAARARTEYENYLRRYPQGEDSERVRQRLASLAAVPQSEPLRAPVEAKQGWRTFTSGSFSQFYYRGNSKIDSQQTVANVVDRTTLSVTDQSSLITALDLNTRFSNDTHDNRIVLRDVNTRNYLEGQDSINRLNAAYYDYKYKPADLSARVGRQPAYGGGILGRFDGMLLGYGVAPRTRLNLVAGTPVEYGFTIDSTRRFLGAGAELGPFNQSWTGNVYFLNQTVDSIPDRQVVGSELRYFSQQGFFSTLVDYDTLFRHLNIATMQGNWTAPWKTTYNLLLDYRMSPALQTTTAVIGESTTSVRTLLNTYSEEELRARARALTAETAIALAGFTHPVTKVWQLGVDLQASRVSHTEGTNNFPATPSSGNVYTLTSQAIATGLFAIRDVTVAAISGLRADTYDGLAARITSRFPLGAHWTADGAVFWYAQKNDDGSNIQRVSPVVRLTYMFRNSMSLEAEAGIERTLARSDFSEETTLRNFFSLGYRWDF
ncbi:MAG TPA: tetratricopeptide repeat protein [Burkholderiales bacterium]|nr:tetratricopeptide repeat protein [Burkholderiales bacterium]